jgi:hypothetical protein
MLQKSKPEPGAGMAKAKGKPIKPIGPQRPRKPRKMKNIPQAKKDEQGRYGMMSGGLVSSAMEVQKPN